MKNFWQNDFSKAISILFVGLLIFLGFGLVQILKATTIGSDITTGTLDASGEINASNGYKVDGNIGIDQNVEFLVECAENYVMSTMKVRGGLIVGYPPDPCFECDAEFSGDGACASYDCSLESGDVNYNENCNYCCGLSEVYGGCWNGTDDDGDGDIGCDDTDCSNLYANENDPGFSACSDGVDNDCDGLIDFNDPDCAA
jgi:hypothetical protein